MRISELSRFTGVSIRSLRHYEHKGLIHPARLENGYRDYEERVIEQVRLIQLYLKLGLNIDEISILVSCTGLTEDATNEDKQSAITGLLKLYKQKVQRLDSQIQELSTTKSRLLERIQSIEEKKILNEEEIRILWGK
uniref:Transcriptional regulator n=1 Tax=Thermosporothrix sp. COM3 TaxID=2490863 RepID=A0A455SCA9_9CHLR|nr:transcriptional regulator [Thermosporothrix sp. COM3]